jgi:hypothetical protein
MGDRLKRAMLYYRFPTYRLRAEPPYSSRNLSARFGFERALKAFVKVGGGLSGVMGS